MAGHLYCGDYMKQFEKLYVDPREPPRQDDPTICFSCTEDAYDEVVEELEASVEEASRNRTKHQESKK